MRKSLYLIACLGGTGYYFFAPSPSQPLDRAAYQVLPKASALDNPNKHYVTSPPSKIGIIGGGIAGCILAKTLHQQGYSIEVLDKNKSFGGLWFQNYDGSGLQFPYQHYNLPDFSFPASSPTLPRSSEVAEYIKSYATHFGIAPYFTFDTLVHRIIQNPDNSWTVSTSHGEKHYDFLVLCTGPYNKPYMPKFKGEEKFKGKIMHSSEFIDGEKWCKGKRVLVVGSGKSAFDILGQALRYGADASIAMRKTHWLVPIDLKVLGAPLGYFNSSRLAGVFLDPFYSEKSWKDSVISYVAPYYWAMVTYFIKKGIPENLTPEQEYKKEKHYRGGARDTELYKLIGDGSVKLYRGSIQEFTEKGAIINGEEVEADTVVCATGFEREFFGIPTENGELWMYRNTILPNMKNFAIVGMINTYCNPLYTNMQAVWLAEVLRGRVKLPGDYKMIEDIKARKEYTRTIINGESTICFSWFPYPMIDQLLNDMGISVNRKKNNFYHWFEPIKPEDYKEVVTHRS